MAARNALTPFLSAQAADDGIAVTVVVKPLRGVGLATLKADGDALPAAAMEALKAKLEAAAPADAADDGGKGKKDAKKGDGEGADPKMVVEQKRLVGYAIVSHELVVEEKEVEVPCIVWERPTILTPAEAAAAAAAPCASSSASSSSSVASPSPRRSAARRRAS